MWILLAVAIAEAQTITLPRDASREPIRLPCSLNRTTRIVFPEPLRQLKAPGRSSSPLQLVVERTKPEGVISVRPTAHPSRMTVEFRGPTVALTLLLESTPSGEASEVRLRFPQTPPPEPAVESALEPRASPSPVATPEVPPPAAPSAARLPMAERPSETPPPSPAASVFDLEGVLRARPVAIARSEGLPGQRPMVLVDALQGERWVWFRFALEGGALSRVARVGWEQGEITTYVQEAEGKDLRVIVQVPRAAVSASAHLSLEVESGPTYTFALGSRSLGRFLKELFR